MIRDLDLSLSAWLEDALPGTTVGFDAAPDRPGPRREGSVLELELVDVRLDSDASTSGWASLRDERGVVVGRVPPAKQYRFTYLVRARAGGTLAEHELLGNVLSVVAMFPVLPRHHLAGRLVEVDAPVLVQCAPPVPLVARHDVAWHHVDGSRGLALEMSVLAPMPMPLVADVAAPPSHVELGADNRGVRRPGDGEPATRPRPSARISEDH